MAKELLAGTLLSIHNLRALIRLMEEMRAAIQAGDFEERIPVWLEKPARLSVNGKSAGVKAERGTFAVLTRRWRQGDTIARGGVRIRGVDVDLARATRGKRSMTGAQGQHAIVDDSAPVLLFAVGLIVGVAAQAPPAVSRGVHAARWSLVAAVGVAAPA